MKTVLLILHWPLWLIFTVLIKFTIVLSRTVEALIRLWRRLEIIFSSFWIVRKANSVVRRAVSKQFVSVLDGIGCHSHCCRTQTIRAHEMNRLFLTLSRPLSRDSNLEHMHSGTKDSLQWHVFNWREGFSERSELIAMTQEKVLSGCRFSVVRKKQIFKFEESQITGRKGRTELTPNCMTSARLESDIALARHVAEHLESNESTQIGWVRVRSPGVAFCCRREIIAVDFEHFGEECRVLLDSIESFLGEICNPEIMSSALDENSSTA